ncbi:MAG: hypothetical protein AAF682_18550 [Planctomycetota bacterium]
MPAHLSRCLVFALLAAHAHAAEILVPGDFADPQAAVDAANPGDVVRIAGGTWGPLVVDKELSILADPAATFVGQPGAIGVTAQPAIRLAGPGAGSLVLSNLVTAGQTGVFDLDVEPGILGGGFDELYVLDSTIRATEWFFFDGFAPGEPGIDVQVDLLVVEGSDVRGGFSADNFCCGITSGPDGPAGIRASDAVLLLDAVVQGGSAGPYRGFSCGSGGEGGPGVEADSLFSAGSAITGGAGADWIEVGSYSLLCTKPDGPATLVTTEAALGDELQLAGDFALGDSITLSWSAPALQVALFFGFGVGTPSFLPGAGWLFLDPAGATFLLALPSPGGVVLPVPAIPSLAGQVIAIQAAGGTGELTRPVVGVLQ